MFAHFSRSVGVQNTAGMTEPTVPCMNIQTNALKIRSVPTVSRPARPVPREWLLEVVQRIAQMQVRSAFTLRREWEFNFKEGRDRHSPCQHDM